MLTGSAGVGRLDHVGVVVDDLPAAVAFFRSLGFECGEPVRLRGDFVDRVLGMPDVVSDIVAVRPGPSGAWLELTRFVVPRDEVRGEVAPPTRPGIRHVAFEVDDLDALLARSGVRPVAEVVEYERVYRLCYLRGPEGMLIELAQRIGGSDARPGSVGSGDEASDGGRPVDDTLTGLLDPASVRLHESAADRMAAVRRTGEVLVEAGAATPDYVEAMLERERSVSTYVGEGVAIPHGTLAGKASVLRDALAVLRFPDPVDWDGEPVTLCVGIAAAGGGHIALLSRLAGILLDPERAAALRAATTPDEVYALLQQQDEV